MKTLSITLYKFDELAPDTQSQIIDSQRWNIMESTMNAYNYDYRAVLEAFTNLTNASAGEWSVDYSTYYSNAHVQDSLIYENPENFDSDVYLSDLSGKLLYRYLNNNILPYLIKGKYYSTWNGRSHKSRHSKILKNYDDCPLTGMVYDYDIIEPILKFCNNWPKMLDYTYLDLMQDCFDSFFKTWHEEYKYWASDEGVKSELADIIDAWYYADGTVYKGPVITN